MEQEARERSSEQNQGGNAEAQRVETGGDGEETRGARGTLVPEALVAYRRAMRELRVPGVLDLLRHDLSLQDLQLLVLAGGNGTISIGEFAARTGQGRARAGQIVDGAVRRGLVSRQDDPRDRRRALVRLTAHGENLTQDLFGGDPQRLRRCFQRMSGADLRALTDGLGALIAALVVQQRSEVGASERRPDSDGEGVPWRHTKHVAGIDRRQGDELTPIDAGRWRRDRARRDGERAGF